MIIDHVLQAAAELGPSTVLLLLMACAAVIGLSLMFTWSLKRLYSASSSLDGHAGREEDILKALVDTSGRQGELLTRIDARHEMNTSLYQRQTDTLSKMSEGLMEILVRSRDRTNLQAAADASQATASHYQDVATRMQAQADDERVAVRVKDDEQTASRVHAIALHHGYRRTSAYEPYRHTDGHYLDVTDEIRSKPKRKMKRRNRTA